MSDNQIQAQQGALDIIDRCRETLDLLEIAVLHDIPHQRLLALADGFNQQVGAILDQTQEEIRFSVADMIADGFFAMLDHLSATVADDDGAVVIDLLSYEIAQADLASPFINDLHYRLFVLALRDRFGLPDNIEVFRVAKAGSEAGKRIIGATPDTVRH